MRLFAAILLIPLSVQSEVFFLETEFTTLLKSTYSFHAGTSAGMEKREIYATYMEDDGYLESLGGSADYKHKSWGFGFRQYRGERQKGRFWGLALRSADVNGSCHSGNPDQFFSKHTATIFSLGNRTTTGVAFGKLRGHVSWQAEAGLDHVDTLGETEIRTVYGISLTWGLSIL